MRVDAEDDLPAVGGLEEPGEEADEDIGIETTREHHEPEAPQIADGRARAATESAAGCGNDRRLASWRIGASDGVVRSEPHLVSPENQGIVGLCPPLDGRALLVEPGLHGNRIAFTGSPCRLLRREAPILQGSACRPGRDPPSGVRLDEFDNRLTRPKSERKLELVKALALNGPNDLRLLFRGNRSFLRPPSRQHRVDHAAAKGFLGFGRQSASLCAMHRS